MVINETTVSAEILRQVLLPGLVSIALWVITLFLIFFLAIYIYTSLAYVSIAKKNKRTDGALAWIPFFGKPLLSSKIANMHWWPVLLLITFFIPFLNFITVLLFMVYWFIWNWKVFQSVGKPGAWILLMLIPFAGAIIYFVLLGVAAWGEQEVVKSPEKVIKPKVAKPVVKTTVVKIAKVSRKK